MSRCRTTSVIILVLFNLSFLLIVKTEVLPLCETLEDVQDAGKSRRTRALCDGVEAATQEDSEAIPDFDLNQIDSENDVNQILKRFRRGRFSSSGGGGRFSSSSSGSRFSSGSSRSSSSGSRFFGGSRSSSSSSSGSSRIFSRSSGGSSSSSSGSRGGIFSRGGADSSSHRVREAIRSVVRKPTSSGSGTGGLSGTGGTKPSLTDKIRKITHGSGTGSGSRFATGGSSVSGSRFGTGGFSGSGGGFGTGSSGGGSAWVRAGKTFLPHAVRFGKRYYQRRKYNKGMYAAAGAGAGYYAGSRMNNHHNQYYPSENYGYPPDVDQTPAEIDGKAPTVFYCLQQDLNATLVNKTLDDEGFGVCNVSGKLLTCPIEIECKTAEADNCCEDEQGTPYCCGGPIPVEYTSQSGGYGDDWDDAAENINKLLNIITAICMMLATICFTVWQQRE